MVTLEKSKVLATTNVKHLPADQVWARYVADGRTADVSTGERYDVFARSASEAMGEFYFRKAVARWAAKK